MYKFATSLLELNPDVQEALKLLKDYHTQVGLKTREPHERWKGREHMTKLSPIPEFETIEGSPKEEVQAAVQLLQEAMINALQMGIDSGELDPVAGKKYQSITADMNDPKKILDWYHTFIARLDPEIQQDYVKQEKAKSKHKTYREKLSEGSRANKKLMSLFDQLNEEDAIDFAKYYLSGRWKTSDDVVRFGERMLNSYKDKTAQCLRTIKTARQQVRLAAWFVK